MDKFVDYLGTISQVNGLEKKPGTSHSSSVKIQWLFYSGMLFLSRDKWWGDFKKRSSAHEGIDICYYRLNSGEIFSFDESIKVPAINDGLVLNICDDFLGRTIVIQDRINRSLKSRVLFIYAHVAPVKKLKPGMNIKKNEIIARVCNTCKNPQLTPHLHFSCCEIPENITPEKMNWNLFSKHPDINLINPFYFSRFKNSRCINWISDCLFPPSQY